MSEQVRARERERDLDRFLTFVDAIVAIAITLLVLPLVELTADLDEAGSVAALLRDNVGPLWSFALSFYVIARFWTTQHHAVGTLLRADSRITTLLLVWSFTIVVLPFPTSLVASSGSDESATKVLYVGTMVLSVLTVTAVRARVGRHPELTDGAPYAGPVGGLVTAASLVVALVLMLVVPGVSYFPLLVLVLDGAITRRLANRGL